MEHCYSYDFSKQNYGPKIKKQSCKLFKIRLKEFEDFKDFLRSPSIRSVIDPGSTEFDLGLKEFENCKDIKTDKAWFKLLHLLFGFRGKYDVKKIIAENIELKSRDYSNYETDAKEALSSYIELLRTGDYIHLGVHTDFYMNMSVGDLVDLLEEELLLRTTIYHAPDSPKAVIVEITDYYYDYDALYKKYGIDPEDDSSESYIEFINYITTSEHTELLMRQQTMYAQMWGE